MSLEDWAAEVGRELQPDVIVYVLASERGFGRGDREYLKEMLTHHGTKVVIAINQWAKDGVRVADSELVEQTKKRISALFEQLFPGDGPRARFVEIDARAGTGMNELTAQICDLVAPEKLGNMHAVLTGDLKHFAARERDSRFQHTLNRIAARLACRTVDQKTGDHDLIGIAAAGIAQYAVTTFQDLDMIEGIRRDVDNLVAQGIADVKSERSVPLMTQEVETRERDIVERDPVLESFETTSSETRTVTRVVEDVKPKGFLASMGVRLVQLFEHLDAVGDGAAAHRKIKTQAEEDLVTRTARQQTGRTADRGLPGPDHRHRERGGEGDRAADRHEGPARRAASDRAPPRYRTGGSAALYRGIAGWERAAARGRRATPSPGCARTRCRSTGAADADHW